MLVQTNMCQVLIAQGQVGSTAIFPDLKEEVARVMALQWESEADDQLANRLASVRLGPTSDTTRAMPHGQEVCGMN